MSATSQPGPNDPRLGPMPGPAVLLLALWLIGCEPVISPDLALPLNAVLTSPPDEYRQWYAEAELCTGETGSFEEIRWFSVPADRWWDPIYEQYAIGTWRAPHDIYLAQREWEDEAVVKHEMVHDLLQGGLTHDPRFGACSGIAHPV